MVPPVLRGEFGALLDISAGLVSLGGVLVSMIGIVLVGGAGMSKERELDDEVRKASAA